MEHRPATENGILAVFLASLAAWSFWQPIRSNLDAANVGVGVLATGILIRNVLTRPPPRSSDTRRWVLALALVSSVMFIFYEDEGVVPSAVYRILVALHVIGDVLAISLGRSFSIAPALRAVRTNAGYGIVRHPLYALYVLTDSVYVSFAPTPRNAAVLAVSTLCLVSRALIEERLLLRAPEYRQYFHQVRWRLLPGVF